MFQPELNPSLSFSLSIYICASVFLPIKEKEKNHLTPLSFFHSIILQWRSQWLYGGFKAGILFCEGKRSWFLSCNYLHFRLTSAIVNCSDFSHSSLFWSQFGLQVEQGIPILSKWLIFNRFKFVLSKGLKVGPAFLLARWVVFLSTFIRN